MFARTLDDQDLDILKLLQKDATLPQRKIAEKVSLSAPAVQRRIAKLEEEGVIKNTVAVLDPSTVGYPITVIVNVTLITDRSETVAAAKKFFKDAPEVQQCYWVTGTVGFVLILLVPSMEGYDKHIARLFADNELVRSYSTTVVLDRVKVTLNVPLP